MVNKQDNQFSQCTQLFQTKANTSNVYNGDVWLARLIDHFDQSSSMLNNCSLMSDLGKLRIQNKILVVLTLLFLIP